MSWFDCSLCYRMRNEEEIKYSIHDFWLLNESLINVCSLRWINYLWVWLNLEESLSHSLVYYDKSVFWNNCIFICINSIFHLNNFIQLFKLISYYLLSHRIANSISINKYMIRQFSIIMVFKSLEGTFEISLQNLRADDFLSFLTLRTCLSIVFA